MTARTIRITAVEVQISASKGSNGAVTRLQSASATFAEQSVCVTPEMANAASPIRCRAQARFTSGGHGKWSGEAASSRANSPWKSPIPTSRSRMSRRRDGWAGKDREGVSAPRAYRTRATRSGAVPWAR